MINEIKNIKIFCSNQLTEIDYSQINIYFLEIIINNKYVYLSRIDCSFNNVSKIIKTIQDIYNLINTEVAVKIFNYSKYTLDPDIINSINKSFFFKLNNIDSFYSDIKTIIEYNMILIKNGIFSLDLTNNILYNTYLDIDDISLPTTNDIEHDNHTINLFYINSIKCSVTLIDYRQSVIEYFKLNTFYDITYITTFFNVNQTFKTQIINNFNLIHFESITDIITQINNFKNYNSNITDYIIKFITDNYIITNNISNRIHINTVSKNICNSLSIPDDNYYIKNIQIYLNSINIKHKKYSDGIYLYGLIDKQI